MVERTIIKKIRRYLHVLRDNGFPVTSGILYGSYARGEETPDSDIDVMVLSSLFDKDRRAMVGKLWTLAWNVDNRIEPVPVGEERFKTDNVSPLLAIARQEGVVVRIRKTKVETAG